MWGEKNLVLLILRLGKVAFRPLQLVLQPVDLILELCLLVLVGFLHGNDLHHLLVILCSLRVQLLLGLLEVGVVPLDFLNKSSLQLEAKISPTFLTQVRQQHCALLLGACSMHLAESLGVAGVRCLSLHAAQSFLLLLKFFFEVFLFHTGLQESKEC